MRYNVHVITDRTVITTTVEADDDDEAHAQMLETLRYDLDLNIAGLVYRIDYERLDADYDTPEYIPELDGVYEGDSHDTESIATAKNMHREDY